MLLKVWAYRLQRTLVLFSPCHLGHTLNSLRGLYRGLYRGTTIGVIKGDTRSLDNGSFGAGCQAPSSGEAVPFLGCCQGT